MTYRISVLIAVAVILFIAPSTANSQERRHCGGENVTVEGNVDGQRHLIYTGRAGTFRITGKIDGASTVDLRDLDADEIIIDKKVDGKSVLICKARGDVKIDEKIDGQSKVVVLDCRNFKVKERISGGRNGTSPGGGATEVEVTFRVSFDAKIEDARVIQHRIP